MMQAAEWRVLVLGERAPLAIGEAEPAPPFLFSPPTPASGRTPPLPEETVGAFGGGRPSVEDIGLDSPRRF